MTTESTKRQQEDKRFIQNPGMWPSWPFLPIKRYSDNHSGPECGVLFDQQPIGSTIDKEHESLRTIVLANLFNLKEEFKTAERKSYESVDAMLADGWMVD